MKKFIFVLLGAVFCIGVFAGCSQQETEMPNNSDKSTVSSNRSTSSKSYSSSRSISSNSTSKKDYDVTSKDIKTSRNTYKSSGEFHVDWDKCIQDTKESITNPQFYGYVKDVYIEIDQSQKKIVFTAVVDDSTSADTALDYADTMVRQFNTFARLQDSSIDEASKDSYGGIYKQYTALVGVSSLSNTEKDEKWFVNQTLYKGLNHKLQLNKAYR